MRRRRGVDPREVAHDDRCAEGQPVGTTADRCRRALARRSRLWAFRIVLGGRPATPSVASLSGHHHDQLRDGAHRPSVRRATRTSSHFARCLRAHGVNEPDPFQPRRPHAGSRWTSRPHRRATGPHWRRATTSSRNSWRPRRPGAAAELAQWLPALTRYAQCMRAHDIAMLDPGPQGQLNLGNGAGHHERLRPLLARSSAPRTRPAAISCRRGVQDDGTGP